MRCLSRPFHDPPIRAGYDCFLPTQLYSAYTRFTSILSSTQANLLLWNFPTLGSPLWINKNADVTAAMTAWSQFNLSNSASIATEIDECRILSMGIRVYPLLAATAQPGVCHAGIIPDCSQANAVAFSGGPMTGFQQIPSAQVHVKTADTEYFEVSWRPGDNSDFEFKDRVDASFALSGGNMVAGASGNVATTFGPSIFMCLTGFPVSTSFYVEIITHLEGTSATKTFANVEGTGCLADEVQIPSMEMAYRRIRNSLPDPVSSYGIGSGALVAPLILAASLKHGSESSLMPGQGFSLL